ncbi:MAG: type II toxin-antitoxin system RelE/ParE family toxin [Chitinophagales bacterium]|nr:type II toxin-antitoxin system RelE/ParE family toxin [Chitinophagales bacterium]
MKVEFTEQFFKDLDVVKDRKLKLRIADAIDECKNAKRLTEVRNMKKMEGHTGYYRIRIGDFRIGIEWKEGTIWFLRLANRKDIYKIFP